MRTATRSPHAEPLRKIAGPARDVGVDRRRMRPRYPFEHTHGFQVDGVSPTTATVPGGWENRLIPARNANTNEVTGWCLEVHHIAVAKYFAHRPKDRRYRRLRGGRHRGWRDRRHEARDDRIGRRPAPPDRRIQRAAILAQKLSF